MRGKRSFEVSVDTRTAGRRLDAYEPAPGLDPDATVLFDPDLLRLPVEVTLTTGGLFGRKLAVVVDGLNGAPCPIDLNR